MRISTSAIYDAGIAAMQQQTEKLMQVQQQIASGRRILSPADDPVAAARMLEVSQSQALNQQYGTNSGAAGDSLALEESVLGSVSGLLQDVRDVVVHAGNPTLNKSDRAILASELRGMYQELLGLANSVDGSGQYLFSGYQGGIRPFSESAAGVVAYNGDQGQRLIQVSASRQIAVSDAGVDVFLRIPNGNGSFAAQAAATNGGAGVIDGGTILDPIKWHAAANNMDYTVKFSVGGGVTSYDIIDNVAGTSLLTGLVPGGAPYPRTYVGGSDIDLSQAGPPAFDYGARVNIAGAPADGDSFTIKASTNQDVFKTIDELAQLLQNSPSGAALTNGLASVQRNLDNAMENVLTVRTSTGARLQELESVKSAGDDRALQYSQTLSRLQDLDYAKAASELAQQQVNLEAAQKSFAKVAGLSLFDYL
ncbi:MAG: flagellar hook-associated protein FlgL [Betaproteobacteria bacterium]|nr:flagellar hook-associated protein FlgL [Betaproteobacteria bacterium]